MILPLHYWCATASNSMVSCAYTVNNSSTISTCNSSHYFRQSEGFLHYFPPLFRFFLGGFSCAVCFLRDVVCAAMRLGRGTYSSSDDDSEFRPERYLNECGELYDFLPESRGEGHLSFGSGRRYLCSCGGHSTHTDLTLQYLRWQRCC